MFVEPITRFLEEANELRSLLLVEQRDIQSIAQAAEATEEWEFFKHCGELPYAWDTKGLATYISLWKEETARMASQGAAISSDIILARMAQMEELRGNISNALRAAPMLGRDSTALAGLLTELEQTMTAYLDQFTQHVLQV